MLLANDGNFYGTSRTGGANTCEGIAIFCGMIFRLTPAGVLTVLYTFGASTTDGYNPEGALIQGSDGALYGTTSRGGTNNAGTVFKLTLSGVYSVLYSFGSAPGDGYTPTGALLQGKDGNFYGTTTGGGVNNCTCIPSPGSNSGTVFMLTAAGVETVLYSFGASPTDGVTPLSTLIEASDGNFYGTTVTGGANGCGVGNTNNCGTVFRITPSGTETVIHSFGAGSSDGIEPQGPLIQARDGYLYGTTAAGGISDPRCQSGCGTVFRITTAGTEAPIYSFTPANGDGSSPAPLLIQARDGNLYGTTYSDGAHTGSLNGVIFAVNFSGKEVVLYSFGPLGITPSDPDTGLVQGSDGSFYGIVTEDTGTNNVYRLVIQ